MSTSTVSREELIKELLNFDQAHLPRSANQNWHLPWQWKWDPRGPKGQLHKNPKDFHGVEYPDHTPERNTVLGSGCFGEVRRVLCNGRVLARKKAIFNINRPRRTVPNSREIQALKKVDHRHISQLVGLYILNDDLYSLSYPVADMCIRDYMRLNRTGDATWVNTLINGMGCLSNALAYMHSVGVKHRDIHNENVLVLGGCLIFCDFGGSNVSNVRPIPIPPGPFDHIGPEPFHWDDARKIDVYRLGELFEQMVKAIDGGRDVERWGFDNPQQTELDKHNLRTFSGTPKQIGRRDFRSLSKAMTARDERDRPDAALVARYLRSGHVKWAIQQRSWSADADDGDIYPNTCGECCK
ncbi:kinase-like protein [Mollisia scopiformis]|uniref:Kinase-like protein n=1 Tax=Mollisia scopiformis TaxID=149040 RepID=A0A132BA67_MOLSC|nr:kinase-like protein [Mollisia scopiformis]KUJ09302.1 kinase-like protein [Mollisia scopiformis]